jgi:hypothetical protein
MFMTRLFALVSAIVIVLVIGSHALDDVQYGIPALEAGLWMLLAVAIGPYRLLQIFLAIFKITFIFL